jgi:hypothetical protein
VTESAPLFGNLPPAPEPSKVSEHDFAVMERIRILNIDVPGSGQDRYKGKFEPGA